MFNLKPQHQFWLLIAVVVIIIAMFYPREKPLLTAGVSAHIGNLGGKFQLEAFEAGDLSKKAMVLFYAPWCPHCKTMMPEWEQLKREAGRDDLQITEIDCEAQPEMAQRFGVKGFPTVFFLPKGLNDPTARIEYKGDRKGTSLLAFIARQ